VDVDLARIQRVWVLAEIGEDADTRPRAEAKINDNNTVDFFLNCEISLYEASTGAIWDIIPEHTIECSLVYAWHIVTVKAISRQKCTFGSWFGSLNSDVLARENGMNRAIAFEEHKNGMKCIFLNWGDRMMKGFGVYNFDVLRNWEECSCVKGNSPGLRRIDPVTRKAITRPFKGQLTVDPNAIGRRYGWYTSGDEEIFIYAAIDKGRGTAFVFDESVNDSARDDYMRKYVFTEDAHGVHGKTASVLTQPNSLECRTLVRLENTTDFEEFQRSCTSVVAIRADNEVAGIKLTTTSDLLCSVTLGFQDDSTSSVVSISANRPTTIRGADRWRCITQENHGVNCGNNQSFELFSPDIVNESRSTMVLEGDKVFNEQGGIDVSVPGIKAPGFSWLNDIIEVIKVVATLVTIISIIITLIQVGIYMYMYMYIYMYMYR
jgi:hypothetical protein